MGRIIVGTAGHIDHGKSTLVRALTGTDPDRLPEEKKRGITIDLGYAFLDDIAAIIDVPGHEKLIRNMVAGAATIDFALLIVAADDGMMPQTLEHLQILQLLGVRHGMIVITKADAVEPDWLAMVEDQVRSGVKNFFLRDARIVIVDSLSGHGISELRRELIETLRTLPVRSEKGVFRLPIDRVFTVKGRGTVITGTILSGSIQKDTRLAALPGGFDVRVKRLENHGSEQDTLYAGERAALNVVGDTEPLTRGLTLAIPGSLPVSSRIKVRIDLLNETDAFKERQRLRFLVGTQETIGRVQILSKVSRLQYYANLLLESDAVITWGDRFVLRRYSPLETLGGGVVLEPETPRMRTRDIESESAFAAQLDVSDLPAALTSCLRHRGRHGIAAASLAAAFGLTGARTLECLRQAAGPSGVVTINDLLLHSVDLQLHRKNLLANLKALHDRSPQHKGFSRTDIQTGPLSALPDIVMDHVLQSLIAEGLVLSDGALYREPDRTVNIPPAQKALYDRILSLLIASGFAPPSAAMISESISRPRPEIEKALVAMEKLGLCRRMGLDLFFETAQFERAQAAVIQALAQKSELSVADSAALLGSSRKYVVPFLEYLDHLGITQRSGNIRLRGKNFPG
jgi:selenocysteine-specific elongation factor